MLHKVNKISILSILKERSYYEIHYESKNALRRRRQQAVEGSPLWEKNAGTAQRSEG
jgi:hypothetical protein